MFSKKQLTPEQIAQIELWAQQGSQMAAIQLQLKEQFNFSLTYMETRLLILDLGIELQDEQPEAVVPASNEEPKTSLQPTGTVQVSLDSITLPHALVSGKVTFSDGEQGVWMIDQMGRPSLDPNTPSYQPSTEDIQSFQIQLKRLLESQQSAF